MNFFGKYLLRERAPSENALLEEIRSTVNQINSARIWFESESDEDLIDSCVYQLEALEARYRYLLRVAKSKGLRCDALTGQSSEGNCESVSQHDDAPVLFPL
ncbi:MAG: DUF2508 family protein [Ruminococcaceae bacterium]|nr:DUF2508 family protein [Oscillospiraceae bacterium]